MLIIGLTGPSGAGKGTVASLFSPFGVPSIDTDRIYHDLLTPPSPCLDAIAECFGRSILREDGTLDRKALASMVFAPGHGNDLTNLNHITHAFVLDSVRMVCCELEKTGCPAVLVDAPLLFESGYDKECGRTLAILASRDIRYARITARDGLTPEAANARLDAQKPDDYYITRADAVLYNDGAPCDLLPAIRDLLARWEVVVP